MLTLGVEDHPTLERGVHLRWTFDPALGFPPGGFNVVRRTHRPGTLRSLDLTGQPERALQNPESVGSTVWTNYGDGRVEFAEAPMPSGRWCSSPGVM